METTGPAWHEYTPADFRRTRGRGHKPPVSGVDGLFVMPTVPVGLKPGRVQNDPGQLDMLAMLEPDPEPGESDCLESQ